MRNLTLSLLASAAALAASSAASAQTVTLGQGPNLNTHITSDTTDAQNNNTTVFGSTNGGATADVLFIGNTQIHISPGSGFAAITDSTNPLDTGSFTSLIINPQPSFTAIEFNLSLDLASVLQIDYSFDGINFINAGNYLQGANANTQFRITADGAAFDAIRLTSCANPVAPNTTPTACNFAQGVGSGTGSPINFERQNSIGIQLTNPPTVPEPATWAMMLVGFGAAGYSMRRRRKLGTLQAA